jgi:hypothetical protein
MIITVTRVIIIGDKRIEQTASAQIDRRPGLSVHISALTNPAAAVAGDRDAITNTARALFESIEASDTQPVTK